MLIILFLLFLAGASMILANYLFRKTEERRIEQRDRLSKVREEYANVMLSKKKNREEESGHEKANEGN